MDAKELTEVEQLELDGWQFHYQYVEAETIAYEMAKWGKVHMRKFTRIYRRPISHHSWFCGAIQFNRYEYKHVLDKEWTVTSLDDDIPTYLQTR